MRAISLRELHESGWPSEPFVYKYRSFDIPVTVAKMISALPANCIAVGLNLRGGHEMVRRAERAARKRGIRILWRCSGGVR